MNVIFKLDKPGYDKSLIMMVYRYDSKKLSLSTSISINTEHWNPKSQRIKEFKGFPEYITYNKTIEKYRLGLLAAWDGFVSKSERPSIVQLRESILNIVHPEKYALNEYPANVSKFIEKIIFNINNKKNETSKVYSQILKNFKAFPSGSKLDFKDLNINRLESFREYYQNTPREGSGEYYSRGTIFRHLKHFITIIKKAEKYGIIINNDYKQNSWRVSAPNDDISGNDIILSEAEIKLLESSELDARFDKIRDTFLLGLYTGQRYSDYAKLSVDNVVLENGKEFIQILQKKTKELVKIPYSSKIKAIMTKYNGYPKSISLQKFNNAIKELSELLGFNEPIIIYKDIPALNKVESNTYPKWQFISTHTARRTFCTNAVLKGIPTKVIMQLSGHKNIRTFNNYVRINTNTKLSDELLLTYFS